MIYESDFAGQKVVLFATFGTKEGETMLSVMAETLETIVAKILRKNDPRGETIPVHYRYPPPEDLECGRQWVREIIGKYQAILVSPAIEKG